MLIGWSIFFFSMMILSLLRRVEPFSDGENVINPHAQYETARFLIPLAVVQFAQLIAGAGCEGLMIEYAHREGEAERGWTQCMTMVFRFIGEALGGAFVTFGFNNAEYGGTFSYALPLRFFFLVLGAVALVGVLVTVLFVREDPLPFSNQHLSSQLHQIWRFLEKPVTWKQLIYTFLVNAVNSVTVRESGSISAIWLDKSNLTASIESVISSVGCIAAVLFVCRFLLNANWRVTILVSSLISIAIDLPVGLMTAFNVYRNGTFSFITGEITELMNKIAWAAKMLIWAEISATGYEATSFGLLTSMGNVAITVATVGTNMVDATFTPEQMDLEADTSTVRSHIAIEYIVIDVLKIVVAFACLPLIPRQKREVNNLRLTGNPNLAIPILIFIFYCVVFGAAMTSTAMAMFKSTSCRMFAGGPGCA